MNVGELTELANWLKKTIPATVKKYEPLQAKLQHNSQSNAKQPLQAELYDLTDYLDSQRLQVLSDEQLGVLDAFGAAQYLGSTGSAFAEDILFTEGFDPASAYQQITSAVQTLQEALARAEKILSALDVVNTPDVDTEPGRILVRVRFDGDASINDVVSLKKWAASWHDIARGISIATDDGPGSVRVVSATHGSLIITLSQTLAFAAIFGAIMKIVTNRARDAVALASEIEDLRHKRLLNAAIEKAMNDRIKEIQDGTVEAATKEVKQKLGTNTDTAALSKAIKTLLDFFQKGGDVDFVSPPRLEQLPETVDDEDDEEAVAASDEHRRLIAETETVRKLIEEIRESNQNLQLLTDQSDGDEGESE